MSAFSDMLADDVASVFLNADEFAETFTYFPKNGPPVTGIVGAISEEKLVHESQSHRKTRKKVLHVLFALSETTGVTNPQPEDAFNGTPRRRLRSM